MLPRRLFHCYICHFIYIKVLLRSKPFYFNLLYRSLVTGNHGPLIVILLKQYHFLYRLKCNTNQFSDTKPCIFFLFFVSTDIISMYALAYCGYCIFCRFSVVSQLINSFNSHLSIFDSIQFYTIPYAKLLMLIVCRRLSVQPTIQCSSFQQSNRELHEVSYIKFSGVSYSWSNSTRDLLCFVFAYLQKNLRCKCFT